MRRMLKVAQREYADTVKTKTFILSVLMTPVLIGVIVFFNSKASQDMMGPRPAHHVAVTDLSGQLADHLNTAFEQFNANQPQRPIVLEQIAADAAPAAQVVEQQKLRVRAGDLTAYALVDSNVIDGQGAVRLYTRKTGPQEWELVSTVDNLVNRAVVRRRSEIRQISPQLLAELQRHVPVEQIDVESATRETKISDMDRMSRMMVPFFFMFTMFMGIFGMGQHMLTSIIEEKSSRIMEVLLSAISPRELMTGKILGLAAIGLTVVGLWTVAAYGATVWQGMNVTVPVRLLAYFVVYYVLGFLLFSAMLAGIGSICNTIKESQSLMMPISLVFVLPMMAWFNLAQHPDGTFARVLSFIPPLTPMVMVLRISASPDLPLGEILASIAMLAVCVPVVIWAAAKVFRTGVLMYGKRPQWREVLRWVRQS